MRFHTGSPTPRLPSPSSESEVDGKEAPAELDIDVVVHLDAEDVEEEGVDMEEEASDSPLLTGELTELDHQINLNNTFHSTNPTLSTHIHACKTCGTRLLNFAMEIHCHERHSAIAK